MGQKRREGALNRFEYGRKMYAPSMHGWTKCASNSVDNSQIKKKKKDKDTKIRGKIDCPETYIIRRVSVCICKRRLPISFAKNMSTDVLVLSELNLIPTVTVKFRHTIVRK